jgi:Transglutaminase-like superfamily/Coenzyme PQQ synthesis protein D (PqqD)
MLSLRTIPLFDAVLKICFNAAREMRKLRVSSMYLTALQPACTLRHRVVDGVAVLLDLRTAEYIVLDHVATAMWQVLLSAESSQRVALLQRQFNASGERLQADLASFAQSCIERGFLQYETPPVAEPAAPRPARRGFLALRAWWSLVSTARALSARGFANTYLRYSRISKPTAAEQSCEDLVERAELAFVRAEHLFVMRSAPQDCLPRSLALYQFLLSAGVPADHYIGVRRYPFKAHAWVKSGNRVLCDSADFVHRFAELARM